MVDDAGNPGGGHSDTDSAWQTPGSGIICPHCGVTVAPGYPKCPKCHAGLPHVPSPLHRTGTMVSGGTTAATGGGSGVWWVAVVIVLIAGAVAVFAMRGRGGKESAATAEIDGGTAVVEDEVPVDDEGGAQDEGGGEVAAVMDAGQGGDADMLEELNAQLAEARVWSSVDEDADDSSIVRVVSAHCDDDNLRGAIGDFAARLKAAGYAKVQCYSQHGTLDYERTL